MCETKRHSVARQAPALSGMRCRRVLLLNSSSRVSGAETSLLLLVGHLPASIRPTVACPPGGELAERARRNGAAVLSMPPAPSGGLLSPEGAAFAARSAGRLRTLVRRCAPDLLHANGLPAGVCAAIARAGVPIVWHVRDLRMPAPLARLCGRAAAGVVAISGAVRDRLLSAGVPARKVAIVPNGVAVRPDRGGRAEDRPGLSPRNAGDPATFVNAGQLVPWKRQLDFLEAASGVARRHPEARFLLAGDDLFGRDGAHRRAVRRRMRRSDLGGRVRHLGWCPDMSAVWARADCLVHAAVDEPFGRVLIEAMAAGLPVIAPNAAGPAEIVQHGRTGLLTPPGDVEALAEAMERLCEDRRIARRMGRAGRRRVRERYTAAATARGVEAVWGEVWRASG